MKFTALKLIRDKSFKSVSLKVLLCLIFDKENLIHSLTLY